MGKILVSHARLHFFRAGGQRSSMFSLPIILFLLMATSVPGSSPAPVRIRERPHIKAADLASALESLEFRSLGPAVMGGRVDDLAVLESNPKIVYAGLASGGLWKTSNAGTTWDPLFDNEAVSTIGSVAVAPSDPSIVWVGTGEPNNRQSSSWGNGVYKSTDAGLSWKHMGLADTHHIGRVLIHPRNPEIVYVAALGRLWGPNRERGVFKSSNGGLTWQQVLFINEDTGAVDMAMDPRSPDTLLAAVYQRRRTVFGFNGGGPHSAIYKTTDGGAAWRKLVKGLPYEGEADGETGRIGLNIYRRDPSIIYAVIEHAGGGVFRSEDGGETWLRMSETNPRPAYFSKIRVDPNDDRRVWVMGKLMYYSEDGGRTFSTPPVRIIHGDHHAMWINPADSNHMILGNDGGVHWSWDAGKTWEVVNNIAIGQFYQVDVDMRKPYFIYGGLQDNGTWGGPSRTLFARGVTNITNQDWYRIGGADGFYVQVDPTDPMIVYAETQDGRLFRRDLRTYESRSIRPVENTGDPTYRFQWNSPFAISGHDPKTIYFGAQFLFKSSDRGDSWARISADLTTGIDRSSLPIMGRVPDARILSRDDGVQNWPCITTIGESLLDPRVIWVGTDDGQLQVTRDGGKSWRNVSRRVPGLPEGTYVSRVIASRHLEGAAYAAFDGHRMNDFGIYIYATSDFGETWRTISTGLPRNNGSVNVIREHHRNPDLLFAGTEYGAFVSFDRGAEWLPLKLNLPTVPVDDIAIHPRENDLILGTHGRSIWILDDITPLEELNGDLLVGGLHLCAPRTTVAWRIHSHEAAPGHKIFNAPNPPNGALLTYYLNPRLPRPEKVRIRIDDASGRRIREFDGPAGPGLNRTAWDLRHDPPAGQASGSFTGLGLPSLGRGPLVRPGRYIVTVSAGAERSCRPLDIEDDPRIVMTDIDRAARHEAVMRIHELSGVALLNYVCIRDFGKALRDASGSWARSGAPAVPGELQTKAADMLAKVDELRGRFVLSLHGGVESGSQSVRRPPTLVQRLGRLGGELEGYTAVLHEAQVQELRVLTALADEMTAAVDRLLELDLASLNAQLARAGFPRIEFPGIRR